MIIIISLVCVILGSILMTNKDKSLHGIGAIMLLLAIVFCGIAAAQFGI